MGLRLQVRVLAIASALAAFVACGTFGADVATGPAGNGPADGGGTSLVDGSGDGATRVDSGRALDGGALGRCDIAQPFTSTTLLMDADGRNLGAPNSAASPTLTADEQTIVFASTLSDGTAQLMSSVKMGADFSVPVAFSNIPLVHVDGSPSFAMDAGLLIFTSDRNSPTMSGPTRIYGSRRSGDGSFGAPTEIVIGNGLGISNIQGPFLAPNGTQLFFSSTAMPSPDLYSADALADGGFRRPADLTSLNSVGGEELSPVLSADGLTMYFASDRDDFAVAVSSIFVATRTTTASGFELPHIVQELHDPTIDRRPGWLSPDSCRLYFSAPIGNGNRGLYFAARVPKT